MKIKTWCFRTPYSCNKSGLWPFNLWFYRWGIGFHFLWVADAHIELKKKAA